MDLIRLPEGKLAPTESDCIAIEARTDGRHDLSGSALLTCGDTDEADSVSMVSSDPYDSYEAAEQAGIAWAADHCVETLYVATLPVGRHAGV